MKADQGDRLIEHRGGAAPSRDGEILEVHGENGGPPYLVRWADDGHVALVFPGEGSIVEHLGTDPA
jgi:hypothetical protein